MTDIKDILGVERASNAPITLEEIISPKRKKSTPKEKEPKVKRLKRSSDGLIMPSEEVLFSSIVPTISIGALKEKRKLTKRKAIPWVWKPFRNSARKDGVVFFHWAKRDDDPEDYSFVRFNKKISMFDYTDEQYEKHFSGDPNWTREETDQLWHLCKQFDLRFVVIADRFQTNGKKTMEDLKERYYRISTKLLELNASPDEDISKHPLMLYPFNKEHEIKRKQQYEILYQRTPEQIKEEEYLMQEFKRIESSLRKHQNKKRKKNTFMKFSSSFPVSSASPLKNIKESKKLKKFKRKGSLGNNNNNEDEDEEEEENFTTTTSSSLYLDEDRNEFQGPYANRMHFPMSNSAAAAAAKLSSRKEKTIGVFLRSHTVLIPMPVSKKMNASIDEMLLGLGIGIRPMPAATVCILFNKLREDIIEYLELQRRIAQKEYHTQVLRDQKEMMLRSLEDKK